MTRGAGQYDLGQALLVGQVGSFSSGAGLLAVELGLPVARADGLLGLDWLARYQVCSEWRVGARYPGPLSGPDPSPL